jgi:hypothetical protein
MAEHVIELPDPPEAALSAVGRAAELWGADFEREGAGGRLRLPVIAGLRRGIVSGPLHVEPLMEDGKDGARVVFRPDDTDYYVHTPAVVILLISVAGAILTVLWPFFPSLLTLAPFGVVLALGGWFLVLSRLRSSGPDEFLETLAGVLGEEEAARARP